ncbi:MAG: O-antigen ligase family protein [Bacteroides sp.]|nr:O-antigen ligase family protein [Bacteroides sp.]
MYMLLLMGLLAMAGCIITQRIEIFSFIVLSPVALLILLYAIEKPLFSFILFSVTTGYFSAIYRYASIEGLSVLLDCSLAFCLTTIIINVIANRESFLWKNGFNILTLTQIVWVCYCFFILLTPQAKMENLIGNRSVFITLPLTYFISGILLCSKKKLRMTLFLIALFAITAFIKVYWQKTHGFDYAERAWLIQGAWHTHLLRSGIRYFSFFTDAGNFGSCMGMLTIVFAIIAATARRKRAIIFYGAIAIVACICMMLSGTRGAMVVPLGGLVLFLLLSKSVKIITISAVIGTLIFCFFYFTDMGNGNPFIRRMRTAFRPTEDASFNVRLGNQKRFAYYLKDKPFGVGVGGTIVDTEELMKLNEEFIPTDSYYVGIWVEGGIVGLCLYITLQVLILLRCCYILMFKIKNKQLMLILSALLCGVFGIWLNGYVGRGMGFQPSSFLIAVFLSFVLNGPYIDRQLKPEEKIL